MALALKKRGDAAVVVVPAWHPNIRIVENLPDTKVVRTAFFVNGAAMLIAIALALYLGIQEWKLHEKPVLSDIVLRLGAITPKKIALDMLDFKDTGVSIRATVKGAPDRASGDASAYEKQLRADKVLGPMFGDVNLLTMRKNNSTNRLVIEIFCEYKKGAKKS
jgi:hypothetical protein